MSRWWEQEDISFKCKEDCFKCCLKPGVVNFDKEDLEDAARYLGIPQSKFKKEFKLKKAEAYWEMEVEEDLPCPFLTPQGCGIHPAKPKQCRTYPFWKENLASKNDWQLTAGFCPGIDTGPKVPAAAIKQDLKDFKL